MLKCVSVVVSGLGDLDAFARRILDVAGIQEFKCGFDRIVIRFPFLDSTPCSLVGCQCCRFFQEDHRADIQRAECDQEDERGDDCHFNRGTTSAIQQSTLGVGLATFGVANREVVEAVLHATGVEPVWIVLKC